MWRRAFGRVLETTFLFQQRLRGTSPRATAEYKYDAASGVSTLRQAKSGGQAPALRRSTNTMRLRESPLYVRQRAGDKPPRYGGVQIRCGFRSLHSTSGKKRGTSPRATAEYKYDAASGVSTLRQVKGAGDKPPRYGGVQIRCGFGSLHFTSGKERGTSPRATAEYKYDAARSLHFTSGKERGTSPRAT